MRRRVGELLAIAMVVAGIAGCVADPGYRHGPRHYDDRPYHDRPNDHRPPPRQDDDRGDYKLPTVVCASKDGRPNRCYTDFHIARAEIDKRYSDSPCEYGRSWGYDGNEVWVDRGCRARFVLTPSGRWR